jgi:Flp pilus assembly protein CpaB
MNSQFNSRRVAAFDPKTKLMMLGGGAILVCSLMLGVTVLFTDKEASAKNRQAPQESIDSLVSQVKVFVPRTDIRVGTKLTADKLQEVTLERSQIPQGALRPGDIQGDLFAKVELKANMPILNFQTSNTQPIGNVADMLKPGFRAVTMSVDATGGVEGWATAGAHVDLVVTYLDPSDGKKKSQIAIENAVVLSFNRNTDRGRDPIDGRITSDATVTLAVPVVDAVKLHTARSMGKVGLILRSPDDVRNVGYTEVTPEDFKFGSGQKLMANSDETLINSKSKKVNGFASYVDNSGQTRELQLRSGSLWSPDGN